jgi:hypothetical protein
MRSSRTFLFILLLNVAPMLALTDQSVQDGQKPGAIRSTRGIAGRSPRPVELESRATGSVAPEASVLTLEGPCEQTQKGAVLQSACKNVVTRADIDSLLDLLEPTASPAMRRQFAINYARLVAVSAVANRQHLERDPLVAKQLQMQQKLAYMQVLANAYFRQVEAEARIVPPFEIDKYYSEHHPDFERGEVRRLQIPKQILTGATTSIDSSVLKAKAEELRARAAAGEDFDKVQHAAYEDLGIKAPNSSTKLGALRRSGLPADEGAVFDLDPGQVTQVLDSPNAFVVLKLESKKVVSLDDAKPEIVTLLQRERAKQALRDTTESAKAQFNLQYFGLLSVPELFPPPQVAGLAGEAGMQSDSPQRTVTRRPMPRRRGMTAFPSPAR